MFTNIVLLWTDVQSISPRFLVSPIKKRSLQRFQMISSPLVVFGLFIRILCLRTSYGLNVRLHRHKRFRFGHSIAHIWIQILYSNSTWSNLLLYITDYPIVILTSIIRTLDKNVRIIRFRGPDNKRWTFSLRLL